jgi:hypothetical protein
MVVLKVSPSLQLPYACGFSKEDHATTTSSIYDDCTDLFRNDILQSMERLCYKPGEDESVAPADCSSDCADMFVPFYQHCPGPPRGPPCALSVSHSKSSHYGDSDIRGNGAASVWLAG